MPHFPDARSVVRALAPDEPIILNRPHAAARAARFFVEKFPGKSLYAVKANPAPQILTMLRDKGANFDIASVYELDKVMALGVTGERISYGNTIKKAKDIRTFYEKGVRLYATDSEADLRNIAKACPSTFGQRYGQTGLTRISMGRCGRRAFRGA